MMDKKLKDDINKEKINEAKELSDTLRSLGYISREISPVLLNSYEEMIEMAEDNHDKD